MSWQWLQQKAARQSQPSGDRGNALDLPYPAGLCDQTLSLLVLMFIPHPEQAASEMRRVTSPDGTVAACTWNREGMAMTAVFWEEAVKQGKAPHTAPASRRAFPQ
jgi:hypothetical protein